MTSTRTVAIVDDEPDLVELVAFHLKRAGFETRAFLDGQNFMKHLSRQRPDLVILDLMLPDADGMEICKYLRSNKESAALPIIMLTAKGDETDRWGQEKVVVDRTIDVHIRNLREKLGKAAALIKNIRGVGYKLEE